MPKKLGDFGGGWRYALCKTMRICYSIRIPPQIKFIATSVKYNYGHNITPVPKYAVIPRQEMSIHNVQLVEIHGVTKNPLA